MPAENPMSRPGYFPPPPPSATEDQPIAKWVWVVGAVFAVLAIAAGFALVRVTRAYRHTSSEAMVLIDDLHRRMAAGDVAGLYESSDPMWHQLHSRERSDEIFQYVGGKLGKPQSSSLVSWFSDSSEPGAQAWTFSTTFEHGTGSETLLVRRSGSGYRMASYFISSVNLPALEAATVQKADKPKIVRTAPVTVHTP